MLGGISLLLQKFKLSDMLRSDFIVRSRSIGTFTNQIVFGLFTFDLWVIISFAENTPVAYFSGYNNFADKYALALFTLLLHLFTYIYTYTRENFEEFSKDIDAERQGISKYTGRDVRYAVLLVTSIILCCIVRY